MHTLDKLDNVNVCIDCLLAAHHLIKLLPNQDFGLLTDRSDTYFHAHVVDGKLRVISDRVCQLPV